MHTGYYLLIACYWLVFNIIYSGNLPFLVDINIVMFVARTFIKGLFPSHSMHVIVFVLACLNSCTLRLVLPENIQLCLVVGCLLSLTLNFNQFGVS